VALPGPRRHGFIFRSIHFHHRDTEETEEDGSPQSSQRAQRRKTEEAFCNKKGTEHTKQNQSISFRGRLVGTLPEAAHTEGTERQGSGSRQG